MTIRVGFMGTVMNHHDPGAVWEGYRRMLRGEPQQQELVRRLAETEGGRSLLDDSRAVWRERGFEKAPFDFLFGEESGR
jgi:hypothetical protein